MALSKKISGILSVLLLVSISQAYVGHGEIVFDNELDVEFIDVSFQCGQDNVETVVLEGEIKSTGITSQANSWFSILSPRTNVGINSDDRGEGTFSAIVDYTMEEGETLDVGVFARNDADQSDQDYRKVEANCDGEEHPSECVGNPSFSGCVRPLIQDPHAYDSRDTVATYAFDGGVSGSSFSTLYGSSVFIEEGSIVGSSQASGDTIEQPWIDLAGWDYPWAAGDFSFDAASISDGWTYDEDREYSHHTEGQIDGEEHYEYPDPGRYNYDQGYEDNPEEYCANAVLKNENELEDPQFDCPEDYGLADNLREEDGGTISISSQSVSESHGDINAYQLPGKTEQLEQVAGASANPDMRSYDMEFVEWHGHRSPSFTGSSTYEESDLSSDANSEDSSTGPVTGGSYTDIINSPEYSGAPDFFLDSNPDKGFQAVYAHETATNNIGSVTAHYVESGTQGAYTGSSEGGFTSCTGVNCSSDGSISGCADTRNGEVTSYYFTSSDISTEEWSGTSTGYWTEDDGSFGYEQNEETHDWSVEVDYYSSVQSEQQTVTNMHCDRSVSSTVYTCSGVGGCSRFDYESVREYDDDSHDYYPSYGSSTISFEFERLDWREEEAFNVDPARNTYGDDPSMALFSGDIYDDRVVSRGGFGGHFSPEVDDDPQFNNPSVSSSEFVIRAGHMDFTPDPSGDYFISERVDFGTANADGVFGESNGLIAHASSPGESGDMGYNELLAEREVADGSMPGNFVNEGHVSGEGCGSYYCVNRVSLILENLDNWGNPMNPATGVDYEVIDSQGVESSYSTCRLYQELHEGGPEDTNLRCQFDHAEQYPGGPTYSREQPIYPDDFDSNPP